MVGRGELANAVGLNSAVFNPARILGPAVGGVLIDAVGVKICFALNALSFSAVLGGLALMRPGELIRSRSTPRARGTARGSGTHGTSRHFASCSAGPHSRFGAAMIADAVAPKLGEELLALFLTGGWIGQRWSARWSLAVGGISCLAAQPW